MAFVLMPISIFAYEIDEDGFEVVSKEEKYYKTVTTNNDTEYALRSVDLSSNNNSSSYTVEITKEEYDNYDENQAQPYTSSYIETSMKKLTTYILTNGSYYRYKAVLNWKTFPKVRSYDTIAIGHYASVEKRGSVYFSQTYCDLNNDCRTIKAYYPQTFSTGSAATFKVPSGDLSSLSQTIYFDVQKSVDATVISQKAAGDYAHAVQTVTVAQAKNFSVSTLGINFNSSSVNLYDEISPATALWSGSW